MFYAVVGVLEDTGYSIYAGKQSRCTANKSVSILVLYNHWTIELQRIIGNNFNF